MAKIREGHCLFTNYLIEYLYEVRFNIPKFDFMKLKIFCNDFDKHFTMDKRHKRYDNTAVHTAIFR